MSMDLGELGFTNEERQEVNDTISQILAGYRELTPILLGMYAQRGSYSTETEFQQAVLAEVAKVNKKYNISISSRWALHVGEEGSIEAERVAYRERTNMHVAEFISRAVALVRRAATLSSEQLEGMSTEDAQVFTAVYMARGILFLRRFPDSLLESESADVSREELNREIASLADYILDKAYQDTEE